MDNIWKRTVPGAQSGTESVGTQCLAFIKPTEAIPSEGSSPSLAGKYGVPGAFSDTCWGFQTLGEPTAWPGEQQDYLTCTQG